MTKRRLCIISILGLIAAGAVLSGCSKDTKKEAVSVHDSSSEDKAAKMKIAKATIEPILADSKIKSIEDTAAGTVLSEDQVDFQNLQNYFVSYEISDELFERIYGDDKSYKTYCTVPREDLRYLKLLHRGYDSKIHVGELMVNAALADEVCEIFRILFENNYQIEKMHLIDDYNADDMESIADNNTSAFNFRQITGGSELSNHAGGCAIDINPLNNPYVWYENGNPKWEDPDVEMYLDRDAEDASERHMINHNDLCYQLFAERGWTWGGDWSNPVDYQHFEKIAAVY